MPFWPFIMAASALLLVWGLRIGAWQVPAVIFATYCAVRGIVMFMPSWSHEIGICAAWLAASAFMLSSRAWLPGFFYTLSGLTYPVFLVLGIRMQYLGASAVLAEVFAILALLSVAGGLGGLSVNSSPTGDGSGNLDRLASYSLGVAAR